MRDLTQLNINSGGAPVTRPPPSPGDVSEFEAHFQVSLPRDYLALLRHSNGGHPELDTVSVPGDPRNTWAVNRFHFLGPNRTEPSSLWRVTSDWRSVLGDRCIPVASDSGGNQFVLDLSSTPAAVKICIHDEGFRMVHLADDFSSFIDALSSNPDYI